MTLGFLAAGASAARAGERNDRTRTRVTTNAVSLMGNFSNAIRVRVLHRTKTNSVLERVSEKSGPGIPGPRLR